MKAVKKSTNDAKEKFITNKPETRIGVTNPTQFKNMQYNSTVAIELRKLVARSILDHYDKGNYFEIMKDLRKLFLYNNSNEIISSPKKELINIDKTVRSNSSEHEILNKNSNLIIFNILSALLNWKHQNYNLFYEILNSTLIKTDNRSDFINGRINIDEYLMKLLKKFLNDEILNQINKNYDNIFRDQNIKYMLTESNHTQVLLIILLMIFYTFYGKPFNKKKTKFDLNKDQIYYSLNKLISTNICKEKCCEVCTRDFMDNLIFKTTSYSKSLSINCYHSTNEHIFNENVKAVEFLSPLNAHLKKVERGSSDFHELLENTNGHKDCSKGGSEIEEELKSTNYKYKMSPLSNKDKHKKMQFPTPKNRFILTTAENIQSSMNKTNKLSIEKEQLNNRITFKNKSVITQRKTTINTPKEKKVKSKIILDENKVQNTFSLDNPKITNVMNNLKKEIFNMDDLLKTFADNMTSIKDELTKLQNTDMTLSVKNCKELSNL